jgi:hypothetical protein
MLLRQLQSYVLESALATTRDLEDTDNDTLVRDLIPVRTEEIGVFVELTAEDLKFLKFAFDHDWGIKMFGSNPKSGKSKLRYEKYKSATTLREIVRCGGELADIDNDFSRGFIEFDIKATTTVRELKAKRKAAQVHMADGFVGSLARTLVL